jgi:ribonuclease T2
MARCAVLLCLALLAFGRAMAQEPAEPGHFNYYLLDLSWSPQFCATLTSSPQCAAHPGFVLHGLWPQNSDGTWPANCVTHEPGPTNPSAWLNITPDLSLIHHEWSKHGACTTLDGDAYFRLATRAYRSVAIPPRFLEVDREITMKPEQILGLFLQSNPWLSAANINLDCAHDHLSAVEVCLGKNLQPVSCTALPACRASEVIVTPQTSSGR